MIHGDCMTVTGKTLAENLATIPSIYSRKQDVILPMDKPMHSSGHIVILHGNLAPEGGRQGRGPQGPQDHRPGQGVRR
jgi:dihydroxy-acid dehydratase